MQPVRTHIETIRHNGDIRQSDLITSHFKKPRASKVVVREVQDVAELSSFQLIKIAIMRQVMRLPLEVRQFIGVMTAVMVMIALIGFVGYLDLDGVSQYTEVQK